MVERDFKVLDNFTLEEVESTGSDHKDIDFTLMKKLQALRTGLCRPVILIHNGLTTGEHKSDLHLKGKAVDFKFDNFIRPDRVIHAMISAGFKGVGVYQWPDGHYTYHADLREKCGTWFRETGKPDQTIFRQSFFKL